MKTILHLKNFKQQKDSSVDSEERKKKVKKYKNRQEDNKRDSIRNKKQINRLLKHAVS